MCLTSLEDGILSTLEEEGNLILRAPLSEALRFLRADCGKTDTHLAELNRLLGQRSPFTADFQRLQEDADRELPRFAGGNGRCRWAKVLEFSRRCRGVLTLAPRYENTAAVLDMRGLPRPVRRPFFRFPWTGTLRRPPGPGCGPSSITAEQPFRQSKKPWMEQSVPSRAFLCIFQIRGGECRFQKLLRLDRAAFRWFQSHIWISGNEGRYPELLPVHELCHPCGHPAFVSSQSFLFPSFPLADRGAGDFLLDAGLDS